jgi:hypothetical protein
MKNRSFWLFGVNALLELKEKNPADFVNVSFLKKLEDEGFFKKLSGGH